MVALERERDDRLRALGVGNLIPEPSTWQIPIICICNEYFTTAGIYYIVGHNVTLLANHVVIFVAPQQ